MDLKHNSPVYVDGEQFTGLNKGAERYQGRGQFSLDISDAQPGKTYSDTIHLLFEADF
ncbi:hypothetical protein [Psychromonas aquimarina]|uniref:hypothetical protein n=1 Tax=Psychromonas aquimarina TaxID=444919 RepID=UPI0003F539A1|nr:hypothetical protein [Psychromonas aquimarina]